MSPATFSSLLEKFLQDKISDEELSQMLSAAREEEFQSIILNMLEYKIGHPGLHKLSGERKLDQMFAQTLVKAMDEQPITRVPNRAGRMWMKYAAAVFLIVAGTGAYLFYQPRMTTGMDRHDSSAVKVAVNDKAPGTEGAVLTLADGSSIVLDSLNNGTIATQNGTKILLNSGQIAYHDIDAAGGPVAYNKITTPKGRQFELILADGSKVWLNAASSIRFPASFSGKERRVEISGEAFLEIAKKAGQPFKVVAHGTEVQVLGTSFNINAYDDESAVKTTLVEGSIRVISPKGTFVQQKGILLKPGEQASISGSGNINIVKENSVDMEVAMAWKNGVFHMKNADLPAIMRQIARWYDLEVVFDGPVPEGSITGEVPRSMNLQKVLGVLKASGIDVAFNWEGKKLVVSH